MIAGVQWLHALAEGWTQGSSRGIHFPAWVKGVKTTHWKFFSWQLGGGQEGKPNLRGTLQAFAPVMYADISLVKASHMVKSNMEGCGSIFLWAERREVNISLATA